MDINVYTDDNGKPTEMYVRENVVIDAIKRRMNNIDNDTYWEIRLLPNKPTGTAQIIAQRKTMEEAIERMIKEAKAIKEAE